MPTGYTDALYKGEEQSFEEFVMHCARAFGALVEMRDEPTAPIPDEFTPSDYHRRKLDEASAHLAGLQALTDEEWAQAEAVARAETSAAHAAAVEQASAMRVRYEVMLRQVEAWEPPTQEHVGLRDFMLQQLGSSIEFDCGSVFPAEPSVQTVEEFRSKSLADAQWNIDYHARQWVDEQKRAASRTAWVRGLRASLAAVKAGA